MNGSPSSSKSSESSTMHRSWTNPVLTESEENQKKSVQYSVFSDRLLHYGNRIMASQKRIQHVKEQREALPALMLARDQISIWSILKHAIGKDLSRITMPIEFNEPISFLQRLCEHMEYIDLVQHAAHEDDALKRMQNVTAFCISSLASNRDRVAKPFNPMLGETYEMDRMQDLGFTYVSEQVSHHPPVSAFHCSGNDFTFYGSCWPKIKFFGQTVDCTPKGHNTLILDKYGETYTWTTATCSVHNIVMGTMYIEHSGTITVTNHTNGMQCFLNLKPSTGWFNKDAPSYMDAVITDKSGKKLANMYGEWNEFLATCTPASYDKHFNAWLKEHRDKRKSARQAAAVAASGSRHSPPPNRRFSVNDVNDDTNSGSKMEQRRRSSTRFLNTINLKKSTTVQRTALPLLADSEVIWRAHIRPPLSKKFYHFSMFAIMLNEEPSENSNLPPTDSRLRPDIRLMDSGDIDKACDEKSRLEQKQRDVAKKREVDYVPKWFKLLDHPTLKEPAWTYTNKYFERKFDKCERIFDDESV